MTVDGLTGSASRSFKVISDGNLHVKITGPFKDAEPVEGQLNISLTNSTATTFTAASTSDVIGGVTYDWSITQRSSAGVTTPVVTLPGQSVSFTPTGFACGTTNLEISVTAINQLGQIANDKSHATVFKFCPPR